MQLSNQVGADRRVRGVELRHDPLVAEVTPATEHGSLRRGEDQPAPTDSLAMFPNALRWLGSTASKPLCSASWVTARRA